MKSYPRAELLSLINDLYGDVSNLEKDIAQTSIPRFIRYCGVEEEGAISAERAGDLLTGIAADSEQPHLVRTVAGDIYRLLLDSGDPAPERIGPDAHDSAEALLRIVRIVSRDQARSLQRLSAFTIFRSVALVVAAFCTAGSFIFGFPTLTWPLLAFAVGVIPWELLLGGR